MTLCLLLDEHISPSVAEQIRAKRPEIDVCSIYAWRDGKFAGQTDWDLLDALSRDPRVLVTYDKQMLAEWGAIFDGGMPFAGVVFVDRRTIAPADTGGLVRALIELWDRHRAASWVNRMEWLATAR